MNEMDKLIKIEPYQQKLFNYLYNELNVVATTTEMHEIELIVLEMQKNNSNVCNCKRPLPISKCSENGIIVYCSRCSKDYNPK